MSIMNVDLTPGGELIFEPKGIKVEFIKKSGKKARLRLTIPDDTIVSMKEPENGSVLSRPGG